MLDEVRRVSAQHGHMKDVAFLDREFLIRHSRHPEATYRDDSPQSVRVEADAGLPYDLWWGCDGGDHHLAVVDRVLHRHLVRDHLTQDLVGSPPHRRDRMDPETLIDLRPARVVDAGDDLRDPVVLAGDPRGHDIGVVAAGNRCEGLRFSDAGPLQHVPVETETDDLLTAEVGLEPFERRAGFVDHDDGMIESLQIGCELRPNAPTAGDYDVHLSELLSHPSERTRAILPYFAIVAGIWRAFENISRPPEEVRAETLRSWRDSLADTTPIADLEARKRFKVAGVIQNIRIDPREGGGSIEATIIDGTGEVIAKWLGRPTMSGITLGTGLIMEGIIGRDDDGELVVLNPEYELVSSPEHG